MASRRRVLAHTILQTLTTLEEGMHRLGRANGWGDVSDSGASASSTPSSTSTEVHPQDLGISPPRRSHPRSRENELESIIQLAKQVRALIAKDEEERTVEEYLMSTGLDKLLPKASMFLETNDDYYMSSASSSSRTSSFPSSHSALIRSHDTILHHFEWMGLVNRVVQVALQLRGDLSLLSEATPYVAHQLALLYQCLIMAGPECAGYRASVEEIFPTVKKACLSSTPVPKLSKDLRTR
ncbi:hypothetical protein BJ684DRAFT_22084 [Piptocephalis cylindrospora]|uniref:Uncharacterized protein n=1 Tax=Piptocephalis cylindrospora TaxID=1907219 RepID=A0A4P9XY79_9FUNG|nr:hypothetical protein BJ684DRAFT_22084 [Piptocephalis cylindrospora]|eukprot:RKP11358.1 hypothetical protein BJ684DRAFT_22084 [Piptocephalis cylindrospora]